MIDFTSKNILVTGGTKGIGKQLVFDFRNLGGSVWYTGRESREDDPYYIRADLTNPVDIENLLQKIKEIEFDVVINNAGTNKIGPAESYCIDDYRRIIDLNLISCFQIIQACIGPMIANRYGRIVDITSISSEISMPLRSAYCSSKFGLVGLTKSIAVEVAKEGVLINSVGPGVTETELTESVLGKKKMDEISKNIPLGRLASVKDISNVVMFMASSMNTYMVGQNVIVDGGYTCV